MPWPIDPTLYTKQSQFFDFANGLRRLPGPNSRIARASKNPAPADEGGGREVDGDE